MKTVLMLATTFVRIYLRDRMAVLTSIALMAFMMVLFGTVMGNGLFQVRLPVAILGHGGGGVAKRTIRAIQRDPPLSAVSVKTEGQLVEEIRDAHVIAGVEFARAGATSRGLQDSHADAVSIITSVKLTQWQRIGIDRLQQVLSRASGHPFRPAVAVKKLAIPVVQTRYIDFIFPGMLAMAIMQACLGSGVVLLQANKDGVLRQLRLSPVSSFQLFFGFVLGRLFVVLLHIVVLGIVAVVGFGVHILAPWSQLVAVVTFGCIVFMALGMAVAVMSPSFEAGNLLVQLVSLPMSFLCGVFIRLDQLPFYLRWLAEIFPLTYLAEMLRGMMNLGVSVGTYEMNLLVLMLWFSGALVATILGLRHLRTD